MGTAFLAAGLTTRMAGWRTATGDPGAEARGTEAGGAGRAAPGRAIETGGRIGAPGNAARSPAAGIGPRAGGLAGRGAGGGLAMPGIVGTERRIGSTRKTGGALGGRPDSAGAATGVGAAGADSWGTLVAGLAARRGGRNACTGGLSGMPPRPGRIGEARLAGFAAGGSAMCLDGADWGSFAGLAARGLAAFFTAFLAFPSAGPALSRRISRI